MRRATQTAYFFLSDGVISIHALLAESDSTGLAWLASCFDFYPRSPCGERQTVNIRSHGDNNFYPRSPCGERPPCVGWLQVIHYFYPRSPCGERHDGLIASANFCNFYPRSPCGERREEKSQADTTGTISIHALLAESDGIGFLLVLLTLNFYPRSPCGERHPLKAAKFNSFLISIHALLAESDTKSREYAKKYRLFLSTLSLRRATASKHA